jgi:hypothetical protein
MLVDILISPLSGVFVYGVLHAEFLDCDCRKSACGGGAAGNQHCSCQAHWTHGLILTCDAPIAIRVGEGGEKVQLLPELQKARG